MNLTFSACEVEEMESQLISNIESTYSDDIPGLESLLDLNQRKFHSQHYLILIVKWLLINLYGRKQGFDNASLSEERVERKVKFCQDYLHALDKIDPGISHNRGMLARVHIYVNNVGRSVGR